MLASQMPQHSEPSLGHVLANGMLFNVSWLAIVYTHSAVLAPAMAALHLVAHFAFMGRGLVEARFVLGVSLFGFLLDQVIFSTGVLAVSDSTVVVAMAAPLWISCLWPVLATTLMHAFSPLQKRLVLAALIGAVSGPASYMAGARLSDVDFVSQFWGSVTMVAIWAMLLPALLLAARLNAESKS
ncbi:MAG: hypothetical protein ACI9J0_000374 [Cryomorphaceae bacterium]|jgi:hypothetical protein